jgi:hypothetical protein
MPSPCTVSRVLLRHNRTGLCPAVRTPLTEAQRFDRVREPAKAYDGAYEMRPQLGVPPRAAPAVPLTTLEQ